MNPFEILSLLAIFLSAGTALFVGIVEFRRYHLRLKMRIHNCVVIWHNENTSIVSLQMCFVNPSTRGKTVFHILGKMPLNVIISELQGQYDPIHPYVAYRLPNQGDSGWEYLAVAAQILQVPLDIPPHQSHSGHCWYQIVWEEQENGSNKIFLPYSALDINGNEIASCSISLTIDELMTNGRHADLDSFLS